MPKPYRIGVEIEEAMLGKTMRRLHAMPGVVAIHLDFDRNGKRPHKSNGAGKPRATFAETGKVAFVKILGHKTLTNQQMREAFEKQGRSPSSINSIIHDLKKLGKLSIGPEGYTLTAKGKTDAKAR